MTGVEKVISGGQTGVDLAALDVAIELGLPCGGWCPAGRVNEAGRIADRYPLRETPSADLAQRTEWNVRDADGTLIISHGELTGGTALTRDLAVGLGKPTLVIDPDRAPDEPLEGEIKGWLAAFDIRTLNVAGPRASGCRGIYEEAGRLLRLVLEPSKDSVAGPGTVVDDSDPKRLREAIEAAFDYRGDVTITRRSTGESIEGYVFDRAETGAPDKLVLRLIPTNSDERITIPFGDIAALAFTGKDTAAGKSFENWVKRYAQRKLAGKPAEIESEPLEDP